MNAQQLRNSILQQAIQGKLVPQDPTDEPASVLLQRIRKEKECLVKEGKLKKKDLESKSIEEDEIPFEIPKNWEWVRFKDVFVFNPRNSCDDDIDAGYIPMTYIESGLQNRFRFDVKKWKDVKSGFTHLADGDIAFAKITPCITNLKSAIMCDLPNGVAGGTTELNVFRVIGETMDRKYILYFHATPYFMNDAVYKGTAGQQRIMSDYVLNKPFPLPPLAEQCRIVAKIEELMPLVERYGKAQQALDQLNESLPARLRQSILQEAIQGRLVPQDPKEEPASELLKRILATVNKSTTKKRILTKIKEEDLPENLVDGWEYFYIKDVFFTTSGGTPIKGHPDYYGGNIPWVKSGELNNKYLYDSEQKITELGLKNSSAKFFPIDTVAIAMYGATIGKTSIFKKEMTTNQAICGIFPVEGILPEFVYYFLIAKKQDFCSLAFGGAQPNISQEKIKNTVFPLPPLAEQRRIVAKIEELFGVIKETK